MKVELKADLAAGGVDVMAELDEFWCSDCLSMALFERMGVAVTGSEWACTGCGAAYFDAIDLVVEPTAAATTKRSA
ncbi:MAG: hypothetical protein ACJ73J_07845 [Actinomycetes bacterium]